MIVIGKITPELVLKEWLMRENFSQTGQRYIPKLQELAMEYGYYEFNGVGREWLTSLSKEKLINFYLKIIEL